MEGTVQGWEDKIKLQRHSGLGQNLVDRIVDGLLYVPIDFDRRFMM